MRFPSFYADLFEDRGSLDETPFGTNFLVEQRESEDARASEDEGEEVAVSVGAEGVDAEVLSGELVLLPLEITSEALPPAQLVQELQALTRLKHPGILAPRKIIEREHHHTQRIMLALLRPYIHGEPLLRFATLATLELTPNTSDTQDPEQAAAEESSGEEESEPVVEVLRDSAPRLEPPTAELLSGLSEDTDEVSLIISEVSRSDRYEGIAPLRTRLERLLSILPSLLDALAYLHRYKRYHGALSPDCIFVDADHQPHIADAGLWHILRGHGNEGNDSSLPPSSTRQTQASQRLRQINPYRAPELFLGAEPSASADLYSLGCLLFHAICGEPPFGGEGRELTYQHINAPRPTLLAHQPHCPSSWVRLVHGLMHVDPVRRPDIETIKEVVSHLTAEPIPLAVPTPTRPTSFCGRPMILEALEELAEESRASRVIHPIVLRAGAGQGKHYFVDHVSERLMRRGWVVLRGRCYTNAFDPYQGWRGLIDDLTGLLRQMPEELLETFTPSLRTAATLFPSLAPDQDRAPHAGDPDAAEENSSVQRLEATLAMRAVLDMLSHKRPLLIAIDDLHLATRDTRELLHDVLANDTPFEGMILVTSTPDSRPIFPEREDDAHTHLDVPALSHEETLTLLDLLATDAIQTHLEPLVEHPVMHAPQLIKELVHEYRHCDDEAQQALTEELTVLLKSPATSTEQLLRHVLERRHVRLHGEIARNTLDILSLHAGSLSQETLLLALEHMVTRPPQIKERDDALTELATLRLIKRASMYRQSVASYRVTSELGRQVVLDMMEPEQLTLTHSALSKALVHDPHTSTTQVFEHARRASRITEAKRLADTARLEAIKQLAFSRAAEIQSWLVEQRKETGEAQQRQELAELETASGQHREAALLWQKMAEEQTDELERLASLCEASEAWFYAGDFEEAQSMQERAIDFFGQHYAPSVTQNRWNALKLWWSRHRHRRPQQVELDTTPRLDDQDTLRARVYVLLLQTATMLNTSQAPTFVRRLTRLARTSRSTHWLAHAYQHHALLLLELDLKRGQRHATAYLEEALKLFAMERDFAKQAEVNVTQAYLAQCQGQWDRARALYSSAEELWRASSATTRMARVELDYRRGQLALWHGELDEVTRMIESLFYEERHLAPAQIRGHQLASQRALMSGHIEDVAEHLHAIEGFLTRPDISLLGLWHLEHTASLHIVRGEPEVALGRLDLAWSVNQKMPLYGMPRVRMRHKLRTAQALCALLTRDFYTDKPRRAELLKRTAALLYDLRRHKDQLTTVEHAELDRVRMRHMWLVGKPRRALKFLDGLDDHPQRGVGKFGLLVQRELRGMLLQAVEQDTEAERYLTESRLAYAEHGLYAPLVQEGWPYMDLGFEGQGEAGS